MEAPVFSPATISVGVAALGILIWAYLALFGGYGRSQLRHIGEQIAWVITAVSGGTLIATWIFPLRGLYGAEATQSSMGLTLAICGLSLALATKLERRSSKK
jgi:hypothetical protein